MDFLEYINQGINENLDPEAKEKYNNIFSSINEIYDALKNKLKNIPVKYEDGIITLGLDAFEKHGLPSFVIGIGKDNSLILKQGPVDFTKNGLKEYSDILGELYENFEFIKSNLIKYNDLKSQLYRKVT